MLTPSLFSRQAVCGLASLHACPSAPCVPLGANKRQFPSRSPDGLGHDQLRIATTFIGLPSIADIRSKPSLMRPAGLRSIASAPLALFRSISHSCASFKTCGGGSDELSASKKDNRC